MEIKNEKYNKKCIKKHMHSIESNIFLLSNERSCAQITMETHLPPIYQEVTILNGFIQCAIQVKCATLET